MLVHFYLRDLFRKEHKNMEQYFYQINDCVCVVNAVACDFILLLMGLTNEQLRVFIRERYNKAHCVYSMPDDD